MDVDLRPARYSDMEKLFLWRIESEQPAWYGGRTVDWDSHQEWFKARVDNPAVRLWIAEASGIRVGTCRDDSNGELSYYVDPEFRGAGVGAEMIRQAVSFSDHRRLKACVDRSNVAGGKAALAAGFVHRPDVDFYLLRK